MGTKNLCSGAPVSGKFWYSFVWSQRTYMDRSSLPMTNTGITSSKTRRRRTACHRRSRPSRAKIASITSEYLSRTSRRHPGCTCGSARTFLADSTAALQVRELPLCRGILQRHGLDHTHLFQGGVGKSATRLDMVCVSASCRLAQNSQYGRILSSRCEYHTVNSSSPCPSL